MRSFCADTINFRLAILHPRKLPQGVGPAPKTLFSSASLPDRASPLHEEYVVISAYTRLLAVASACPSIG
jgi:hypothetical protein